MKRNYFFVVTVLLFFNFSHVFSQNTTWYVSVNGTGNGTSWAAASGNLQAVIDNAVSGDQVWVKQGAYQRAVGLSFAVKDGVSVYGGFPNTGNPEFTERNPRQYETILNGNQARVLVAGGVIENISPETIIDGFTIQNGLGDGGAGIWIYNCDATFRNLNITNNASPVGVGAGVNISNSNSTFIQVLIHNNTSLLNPGYDGEAGGISISSGNLKFYNCVIANNHAEGVIGGMWVSTGTVYLYNSIIYGNTGDNEFSTYTNQNYNAGAGVVLYASNCILQDCGGSEYLHEAPQYMVYGTDLGGNLDVDPMFNPDYSLQAVSPGINKGNTQAYLDAIGSIEKDFFDNDRVIDHIDIGLSEHQTVQSEILYVRENGTGDGSSWANASGSLQLMMDNQFEGREVWVAEGTYIANGAYLRLRNKVKVYGGFPAVGNPAFDDRDFEEHQTVLKPAGGTVIGNYCPEGSNLSAETLLDGFVITKNEDVPGFMYGIMDSHSNATYSNILFTNIDYVSVESRRTSQNTYIDCKFINNICVDNDYNTVLVHGGAKPSFIRCSFIGNYSFQGSAIWATNNADVLIDGCLFASNNNNQVSGVGKVIVINHSKAVIKNSVFDGNGDSAYGGGILFVIGTFAPTTGEEYIHPVDVVVDRCIFKNNLNTALLIQGKPGDRVSASNSLFFKNTGSVGGGVRVNTEADFYMTNCTVTQNHADLQWAGGVFMSGNGIAQIRNSIISGNTSVYTYMPDFWTYRPVSFKNTILAQSGGSANWDAGFFNDFQQPDMSIDLGGNLDVPPMFVDAANEDYRLMPASPAINEGDNTLFAPGAVPDLSSFTFDLPGNNRIFGPGVDMGAFEYDPALSAAAFIQADGAMLYPNPTEGIVTAELVDGEITSMRVYSVLGKELMASNGKTIDFSALPKGMYIVKVTTDSGKTYSTKVMRK